MSRTLRISRRIRPAAIALFGAALVMSCAADRTSDPAVTDQGGAARTRAEPARSPAEDGGDEARLASARRRMVDLQIKARGVRDPRVLEAMAAVPRHRFVPDELIDAAYQDSPLPIGMGQTISQPYIVAFMTEHLGVAPGEKVLEVGTGSGYQAAVLAEMGVKVFSIEIVAPLARSAESLLGELGYGQVQVRIGDGYRGWPEEAPFDGIIVTAAPDHVPRPLLEQLAPGARMVIPVGTTYQELKVITRTGGGFEEEKVLPVRFVPMTGEAESRPG